MGLKPVLLQGNWIRQLVTQEVAQDDWATCIRILPACGRGEPSGRTLSHVHNLHHSLAQSAPSGQRTSLHIDTASSSVEDWRHGAHSRQALRSWKACAFFPWVQRVTSCSAVVQTSEPTKPSLQLEHSARRCQHLCLRIQRGCRELELAVVTCARRNGKMTDSLVVRSYAQLSLAASRPFRRPVSPSAVQPPGTLDVMSEKRIEDYWNVGGDKELSDAWTGFTRFIVLNETT